MAQHGATPAMGLDLVEDAVSPSNGEFAHEICIAAFKFRHAVFTHLAPVMYPRDAHGSNFGYKLLLPLWRVVR